MFLPCTPQLLGPSWDPPGHPTQTPVWRPGDGPAGSPHSCLPPAHTMPGIKSRRTLHIQNGISVTSPEMRSQSQEVRVAIRALVSGQAWRSFWSPPPASRWERRWQGRLTPSPSPGGRHQRWTGLVTLATVSHREQHTGEGPVACGGCPLFLRTMQASLDSCCFLSPPDQGTKSQASVGQGVLVRGRRAGLMGSC